MYFVFRLCVFLALLVCTSCGYNRLVSADEEVKAAWSEVLNQYQRRAELVPNLVRTVRAYAKHERQTLAEVVEARAKATSVQVTPDLLNNPGAFRNFQRVQGALSSALSRLMLTVERYPNLKASANFTNLQASLEGTENRLSVARNRYIKSTQAYNTSVRSFPSNLTAKFFDFTTKPNFELENEKETKQVPKVDFE